MSTRSTPWEPGTPCWTDLATTDQPAATTFYSRLFDWEVTDTGEQMGHYGMCMSKGLTVAGVGQAQPGDTSPPAWTTYLAVEDADLSAAAITAAGGTVVMPPMSIADHGRMAIAQDPTGAFFGIWQAGQTLGCQLVNEPGGMIWNELQTRDPARAREFYASVFGYTYTPAEGAVDYTTIDGAGPGNTVGGLGMIDAALPSEVPAHWVTYFAVQDAPATIAAAAELGGTVVAGPFPTPYGAMAAVQDPQGANFMIMQVDPSALGSPA